MAVTMKVGYRCTCGALVPLTGVATLFELEQLQDVLRQSARAPMVTHTQVVGGCRKILWLCPDDLMLIEHRSY
jgi:hypothetical protein